MYNRYSRYSIRVSKITCFCFMCYHNQSFPVFLFVRLSYDLTGRINANNKHKIFATIRTTVNNNVHTLGIIGTDTMCGWVTLEATHTHTTNHPSQDKCNHYLDVMSSDIFIPQTTGTVLLTRGSLGLARHADSCSGRDNRG